MKFAIIAVGGKQRKVTEGRTLSVEKMDKKKDSKVTFKSVLLYHDGKSTQVGKPYCKGISVTGTVVEEGLGKKVTVVKYKSKVRYRRTKGHRQPYTKVKIDKITAGK